MGLSKKLRFEIFKRDNFTCRYCGRKPPDVILQVDHIIAASLGGPDDLPNLITSCLDCNAGKGARKLDSVICRPDLSEEVERLQEQRDQLVAYYAYRDEIDALRRRDLDRLLALFEERGWEILPAGISTLRTFLKHFTPDDLIGFHDLAESRASHDSWKYFCAICWNKIRDEEGT